MVFIIFVAILLHGLFAKFGALYRYEAYLYVLLYLSFYLVVIKKTFSYNNKVRAVLIAALFVLPFPYSASRLLFSHTVIKTAGKNIYDQQIQMSRFLHTYYNKEKIMANDIGAITYFTHIDLLDLVGLGSNSIMKIKMNAGGGGYNSVIDSVIRYPYDQYQLIMIYDTWFSIKTQEDYERLGWIKVAELAIKNNVICGDDTVSFYTSDFAMTAELKKNLYQFKQTIPEDVTITIFNEE
jgi:Ca2+/Na+ antiporter